MVLQETNSILNHLTVMRKDLVEKNVVELKSDRYVFLDDYAFSSPSTAAGVVQGRSANGRDDWKDKHGVSLKKLQSASSTSEDDCDG